MLSQVSFSPHTVEYDIIKIVIVEMGIKTALFRIKLDFKIYIVFINSKLYQFNI